MAITHDRYFLDNVAEWILELDRGRAHPYEGNYSTYLQKKAERLKVEGRKDEKRQKRLKEELEWVRSNAKGRQAKSKARLARYEEMAAEADKMRKLDFEEIQIPPGPRLGSVVVEVNNLSKAFGDKVLIDDLSFTLPRNGIVGIIGPNGAGKTTLFKMIQGFEKPDAGDIKIGETVKISYVDQGRSNIDPKKTLWAVVSDELDYINVGQVEMPSRAYVSAFGFKGPDQQKPAGVLSGGERNRLNLALTLKQGGNLLLLDEPTNDLDVETLSSLENALSTSPAAPWSSPTTAGSRPGRHAHPGVRGRLQVVLVRGQLRGVREEQDRAARPGRDPSAPRHPQEADPGLTVPWRGTLPLPLRWSDMDAFGHVNNVVFLRYLEEARIDFMFRLAPGDGSLVLRRVRRGPARDRLRAAAGPPARAGDRRVVGHEDRRGVADDRVRDQGPRHRVRTGVHGRRALRPGGAAAPADQRRGALLPGGVRGRRDDRRRMTVLAPLHFADAREAAALAAFLTRLVHYDRAAAVRLQAGGGRWPSSGGRRRSRCSRSVRPGSSTPWTSTSPSPPANSSTASRRRRARRSSPTP